MPAETWDRIEPSCTSKALEPGLRAEVADPLWLLARQWQFGEFTGDDAASPIQARLRTRTHRSAATHTAGLDKPTPLTPDTPLEATVEAEPLDDSIGLRVEAGVELAGACVGRASPIPTGRRLHSAFPVPIAEDDLGLRPASHSAASGALRAPRLRWFGGAGGGPQRVAPDCCRRRRRRAQIAKIRDVISKPPVPIMEGSDPDAPRRRLQLADGTSGALV